MLQASDLSKRYGDSLIFDKVSFTINAGDRVGLVGANGCGKTALLRVLIGEETPDTGSVRCTVPRARMGYLPQALTYDEDVSVGDILRRPRELAVPEEGERPEARGEDYWASRVAELASLMERLAGRLAGCEGARLAPLEEYSALEEEYAAAIERLGHAAARLPDHVVERVLAGLGLADATPSTPVRILSGGQKTLLSLARILLDNPPLLLLDEPTNHLDIRAMEWIEEYLSQYAGAMLIVSHDRTFLDHTVRRILEMDLQTHAMREYAGDYSDYVQAKEREREKHVQAYKEQQERISKLKKAIRQFKGHAGKIERETIHYHYRKIAKKIARQGIVRQRRLERLLESEERIEKPRLTWQIKLEFVNTPSSGQDVLILEGLSKRFGERLLFEDVSLVLRRGERIALIGPNGSGKTTLLRIVVGEEKATSGSVRLGANVRVGYLSQEQESLDWALTPLETVRRTAPLSDTEARNYLHYFLFAGDDVFVPVHSLSYGERARLALGVLVLEGCNLLLLDEPINHLDIPSRENFERALIPYEGTVLAVVHDRYFIKRFATGIWSIERGMVRRYIDMNDVHKRSAP